LKKFELKFSGNRLSDIVPTWEEVVMLGVLFFTWWSIDKLFPDLNIGKEIGVLASLAAFGVIAWVSVLRHRRKKKRRPDNKYTRRIDALKEAGVEINHQNIYNKSIRPDFPIDEP
jgi:hypothetical protein